MGWGEWGRGRGGVRMVHVVHLVWCGGRVGLMMDMGDGSF